MNTRRFLVGALGAYLATFGCFSSYAQKKIKVVKAPPAQAQPAKPAEAESSEPDKVLYERALTDLKRHHYVEERLSLQTLINTYPDSEYLAKAKLAVADSYYLEGGVSNYTQAIAEYKSFIVFFPFLDEAAYAQMQVAMAHYRMMEKADRDNSEAGAAEIEFQTFLLKYPDSKLVVGAQQRLRDVQEVLADGQFRVARFYYLRPDYRASAARLVDLTQRYPLYSQTDEALWMLGSIYDVAKKNSKNEDDKNHWADLAANCYQQIVVSYPLSDRTALAKARLKEMGITPPAADPASVARMKQQVDYEKAHSQKPYIKGPMAMVKSSPDFTTAARTGSPNLNPPETAVSATDILNPGAVGPKFNLAAKNESTGGAGEVIAAGGAVVPGTGLNADSPGDAGSGGHQIVGSITTASTPSDSAAASDAPGASADPPATNATPAADAAAAPEAAASDSTGQSAQAPSGDAQTGQSAPAATPQGPTAAPPVGKNESTSKKKKGLSKINPF